MLDILYIRIKAQYVTCRYLIDNLPYAKEGTLDQVLDELYSKEE